MPQNNAFLNMPTNDARPSKSGIIGQHAHARHTDHSARHGHHDDRHHSRDHREHRGRSNEKENRDRDRDRRKRSASHHRSSNIYDSSMELARNSIHSRYDDRDNNEKYQRHTAVEVVNVPNNSCINEDNKITVSLNLIVYVCLTCLIVYTVVYVVNSSIGLGFWMSGGNGGGSDLPFTFEPRRSATKIDE